MMADSNVFDPESEFHPTGFTSQKSFDEACRLLFRHGQHQNPQGLRFEVRGEVRLFAMNNATLDERILLRVLRSVFYP